MVGPIAGDIIGSVFEQQPIKTVDFLLFSKESHFTDDTVLTCAIASALMTGTDYDDALRHFAKMFPAVGYGLRFKLFAFFNQPQQYACGNGAAMRVSPIGWVGDDLDAVLDEAELSARPSHNDPDAIAGAKAVAAAVFMARTGKSKAAIQRYIEKTFCYDVSTPLDVIRPTYRFDATAKGSVPQAIRAFLEAESFEQAVRLAVSLGGDSDTQACIAGAIAEAAFGVPGWIRKEAMARLDDRLRGIVEKFERIYGGRK